MHEESTAAGGPVHKHKGTYLLVHTFLYVIWTHDTHTDTDTVIINPIQANLSALKPKPSSLRKGRPASLT